MTDTTDLVRRLREERCLDDAWPLMERAADMIERLSATAEPVAWVVGNQGGSSGDWIEVRYVHGDAVKFKIGDAIYTHPAAPSEPVAWMDKRWLNDETYTEDSFTPGKVDAEGWIPLYLHPSGGVR